MAILKTLRDRFKVIRGGKDTKPDSDADAISKATVEDQLKFCFKPDISIPEPPASHECWVDYVLDSEMPSVDTFEQYCARQEVGLLRNYAGFLRMANLAYEGVIASLLEGNAAMAKAKLVALNAATDRLQAAGYFGIKPTDNKEGDHDVQ